MGDEVDVEVGSWMELVVVGLFKESYSCVLLLCLGRMLGLGFQESKAPWGTRSSRVVLRQYALFDIYL